MKIITLLFILISIPCVSQLEENLLLHYKFDGNTNDETANQFDGLPNGVTYVDDRFGNENSAVHFDGINDFIDLPNLPELKPQLPVSFSFWIKYESSDYKDRAVFNTSFEEDISSGIFFNSEASTGRYGVSYGDGTQAYTSSTRRSYTSNKTIINDKWHKVIVVVEGSLEMKIYIDCKENGGTYDGSGGNLFYSLTPGSLGRHDRSMTDPANYFKGSLDEFRYWDRALTQEDIVILCENLGIQEVKEYSIKIHPNPAQNVVFITGDIDPTTTIRVFDSLGKLVFSKLIQQELDVSSLPSGVYFVKFINDKNVNTKKLIIR